jgi:hypothetical protein
LQAAAAAEAAVQEEAGLVQAKAEAWEEVGTPPIILQL